MLPGFILLFILCESTVKSQTSTQVPKETLPPLQVVATPDYPVAVGQRVSLHCSASTIPGSVTWSWQRQQNDTWKTEGTDRELTLTKPEQSGEYRCCAKNQLYEKCAYPTHTVYIISVQVTVAEKLGIAAFFFSVLAFIIILATVFWLGYQSFGEMVTTSNTAAKGFPGPEMTSKEDLPQADGDVYMNYTSTKQTYTDVDPTNMTRDSMYASLP